MTNSPDSTSVQWLEVTEQQSGQRIDNFLFTRLKGVPKSRIYRILRKGEVRVNKGRIKPDYKLCAGDTIRIPPIRVAVREETPHPSEQLSCLLADAVLYQDDQVLVIDKPAGLAVHGGSGVSLGLIEALRKLYPEESQLELVHRLDRDTSGCLMVAKSRAALRNLQQQMQEGRVIKIYQALVAGKWRKGLTEVAAPLQKNQLQSGERMVRVAEHGKPALTHFRVIRHLAGATLLEAQLETGRTHQIRVHCQAAGHHLAGDHKYGDPDFNRRMKQQGLKRMFLHAAELHFQLVDNKPIVVRAPLPGELEKVLRHLDDKAVDF